MKTATIEQCPVSGYVTTINGPSGEFIVMEAFNKYADARAYALAAGVEKVNIEYIKL